MNKKHIDCYGLDLAKHEINQDDVRSELWERWDAVPTDDIQEGDFDEWVAIYRRRLLRTQFEGRTGNRNQSVLLSMTELMLEQRERIITTTYPHLVRVCAADHKTILAAVKELRTAGYIRCLGTGPRVEVRRNNRKSKATLHRFALMTENLIPDADATSLPLNPLPRANTGNFNHDAFGGRRGIKRTDLAVLRWLAENPGATRYKASRFGGVSCATAYRVLDRLIKNGLVYMNEGGQCHVVEDRTEIGILTSVVQQNCLYGQTERRVDNAIYPFYEAQQEINRRENPVPGSAGNWGMPR